MEDSEGETCTRLDEELDFDWVDDKGHNVVFNNGGWKVTKGAMVVARGNKIVSLYVNSSCRSTIAVANNSVSSELWHYKLGYMSEKGMKMLHANGKLHGLKKVDRNLCEGCVFGKQKRVSFYKAGRDPKTKKLFIHRAWGL